MPIFEIPGARTIEISHILLDYNGTLAVDGQPIAGVRKKIQALSSAFDFHVITADTFGSVTQALDGVNCSVVTIPDWDQARAKADYLETLGPSCTIACGNGVNDELMLKNAALGVAVLHEEGLARQSLMAADILIHHILDLFGYLEHPGRLIACLRK
ncbi:MAG: ATPase P [Desulfobacter sp.]|nr:ATPase P [Desulfobacter sp.]WDP85430.1 MAG: ATPase P [Desulfobacter sp.]